MITAITHQFRYNTKFFPSISLPRDMGRKDFNDLHDELDTDISILSDVRTLINYIKEHASDEGIDIRSKIFEITGMIPYVRNVTRKKRIYRIGGFIIHEEDRN